MTGRGLAGHVWVLGAIVVAAALVRFVGIGAQSFWLDESATFGYVTRPPLEMLKDLRTGAEANPPLYYVVAKAWIKVLGTDEAVLRSLSALAGVATVPLAYDAARTLSRSVRIGLVAAALVALHPMLVWYSQEARSYALLIFLSALSFALFARALRDPRRRTLLAWGAASGLALATQYFALFLVVVEGGWLLYALRRQRGDVLPACGVVVATAALLLVWFLPQRGKADWIAGVPFGDRIGDLGPHLAVGLVPWDERLWALAFALICLAALLVALRADGSERRAAAVASTVGLLVVGLPLAAGLFGSDYLLSRNVLIALVPLAVAVAVGFGGRRAGRVGLAAAGALCGLWLAVVAAAPGAPERQKADWRAVADSLGPPAGDRIVLHGGSDRSLPLRRYLSARILTDVAVARAREIDVVGFEHPGERGACWSGVACNVPERAVESVRLPAGFRPAGRRRVDLFTVARFRAASPRPVDVERLGAAEPVSDLAPFLQRVSRRRARR